MTIGQELLKELEVEIRNSLDIPREWLPEKYQGKKKTRKLSSIYNQLKRNDRNFDVDPREVSVKFDSNQNPVKATKERWEAIERYRKQAEQEQDLQGVENDDKLYGAMATFCGAMVLAGVMDRDDFIE